MVIYSELGILVDLMNNPSTLRDFVTNKFGVFRKYDELICTRCKSTSYSIIPSFQGVYRRISHTNTHGKTCRAKSKYTGKITKRKFPPKNVKSIENNLRQNYFSKVKKYLYHNHKTKVYSVNFGSFLKEIARRTNCAREVSKKVDVSAGTRIFCKRNKFPFMKILFNQALEYEYVVDIDSMFDAMILALASRGEGFLNISNRDEELKSDFYFALKPLVEQCCMFLSHKKVSYANLLDNVFIKLHLES